MRDTNVPPRKRYRPRRTDIAFLLNDRETIQKRGRTQSNYPNRLVNNARPACTRTIQLGGDRSQLSDCTALSNNDGSRELPGQSRRTTAGSSALARSSKLPQQTSNSSEHHVCEKKATFCQQTTRSPTSAPQPVSPPMATAVQKQEPDIVTNTVPCDECETRFCNLEAVRRHKRLLHPLGKKRGRATACKKCGVVLKSQQNLERHMRTHEAGARFRCPECSARFSTARARTTHLRDRHGRSVARKCVSNVSVMCRFRGCGYASNQKSNVKRHFDNVHLKIRNFVCEDCGLRASTQANLDAHRDKHRRDGAKTVLKDGREDAGTRAMGNG